MKGLREQESAGTKRLSHSPVPGICGKPRARLVSWKQSLTASKNNPQEADLDGKAHERDFVAEICDLRQRLSLSKFGFERFSFSDDDIFFYTALF